MRAFLTRHQKPLALSVFAIIGLAGGVFSTLPPAHACSCPHPEWTYRLESVELTFPLVASESVSNHEPYWPLRVILSAHEGWAWLRAQERGPETLDHISAEAPREGAE